MEGACNISFRAGGQVGEGNLLLQEKRIRDYSFDFPFWETGMRWSLTIPWQELQI
jgi:hypothetical protein